MPLRAGKKKKREREREKTKDLQIVYLGDDLKDEQSGKGEIRQEKEDNKKKNMCYIKPVTPVGNWRSVLLEISERQ